MSENPAQPLRQIVYVSLATGSMGEIELGDLLSQSRRFNAAHHVTGLLLHVDGTFMQVLEAGHKDLEHLWQRIQQDPRHTRVRCLCDKAVPRRSFGDWSMGYRSFAPPELIDVPGFSDFLAPRSRVYEHLSESDDAAHRLLTAFRYVGAALVDHRTH